ncbi:kinase-like protein [Cylindrobasidium torrendii FP15055 ss-10]|uniref:Kinase-like protein n=1 Tax=Cylindrobasidium torrendii FP15055 ss-10 TaxID=1314674 RepID=A0A0D7AY54_9AGAR|nr:kinase-like protein [Cylindrobasidium torrendii FP15055 ss-10]
MRSGQIAIPAPSKTFSPPPAISTASPASLFLSAFSPPPTATAVEDSAAVQDTEGSVVGNYILGRIIGYGASSVVRRATQRTGGADPVAVKIVKSKTLTRRERNALDKEEEIWSSLSQEHILPLFATYRQPNATYFVTPFCEAGSLFDLLDRERTSRIRTGELQGLPASESALLFRQVVRGLRYLHEQAGIVHRDIKLENVLIDDIGNCRIADFGMAKHVDEVEDIESDDETPEPTCALHRTISVSASASRVNPRVQHVKTLPRHRNSTTGVHPRMSSSFVPAPTNRFQPGSLPYAAPELLSAMTKPVGFMQDIWAAGVILYALMVGQLPFVDAYEPRLGIKIRHSDVHYPDALPSGTLHVMRGCLERNTDSRWTAAKLDEESWAVGGELEPLDTTDHESIADTIHSRPQESKERRSRSRARRSASRGPLAVAAGYSYAHSLSHVHTPVSTLSSLFIPRAETASDLSETMQSPGSSSMSPIRGRDRVKHEAYSRSASPSVLPTTPTDGEQMEIQRGRKPRTPLDDFDIQLQGSFEQAPKDMMPPA